MRQNGFSATLVKTNKVDVNDSTAPLPPHKGAFQEFQVADYFCPEEWTKDGVFVRIEEGQPLWIDLQNNPICACLPSIQRLNPVTGEAANLEAGLKKDPQNYLALPVQRWLDGYANDGKVYQFVATKAGAGLAVNEFVLPTHMQDSHALGFAFFAPKNPPAAPPVTVRSVLPDYLTTYYSKGQHVNSCKGSKGSGQSLGGTSYDTNTLGGTLFCKSLRGKLGATVPPSTRFTQNRVADNTILDCCDMEPHETLTSGGIVEASADVCLNYSAEDIPIIHMRDCETKTSGALFPSEPATCCAAPCEEEIEVGAVVDTVDIMEQHKTFDKASMSAGGRIDQRIVADENTVDYYHEKPDAVLTIYLALPEQFDAIMKKGKRQDVGRKDKYVYSGKIGGVQVPLIK